ncbi:hypothetical protein [uncultured Thiodictyon sp.]|uniref:hypothetical protein n=1 Tax=uncultured Thiodictyon sp. TaxID=1846217 RepID=UPI0025ECB0D6|nr:hypothetical protein [uncultured Thiodictyon sp.]
MSKKIAFTLIAIAGLTLGACGPSEPPKPSARALDAPPKPLAASPGVPSRPLTPVPGVPPAMLEQAKQAGQATKQAGQAAQAQLRAATDGRLEKGRGLTETASTQAAQLIPQIKDAVAANKPELARTLMARLESIQGTLPPMLKLEIVRLQALLAGTQQTSIPAAAPAVTPRPASAVHHAPAPPPAGRPAAQ